MNSFVVLSCILAAVAWTRASDYCLQDQNGCGEIQNEISSACEDEKCTPCNSETKIMCYFTNWAWYRQDYGKFLPSHINTSLCTHIIYGFATLDNETFTIASYDPWTDIENNFYGLVTSLKEFGVKAVLALGGWNDSKGDKYSVLVSNATMRKNFVKESIIFLLKYNFTGLEINWEYPHCWQGDCDAGPVSDIANFGIFIKELSQAYRHVGLTVSAAVASKKYLTDNSYDVPALSCYLDWINIINYDYANSTYEFLQSNAPLYAGQNDAMISTLNHWESKGASKCKINLGISSYGRTFTLNDSSDHFFGAAVSGPGTAGNITCAEGVLSFQEICLLMKNSGWRLDHSWADGAVAYKDDQVATFNDVDSVETQAGLAILKQYGGVFYYNLDYDDFNNVCGCGNYPLLTTINTVIRGHNTPRVQCH